MEPSLGFVAELFAHALSYWWLILIATTIGIIIGAMPGFGSANTIIMLLAVHAGGRRGCGDDLHGLAVRAPRSRAAASPRSS